MIDVLAPAGLLPEAGHRPLAEALTRAVLEAERAPLAEPFLSHTAAFVHELPPAAVHTAATDGAPVVRVTVTTPPGALSRDGQRELVAAATDAVVAAGGNAGGTWVVLQEAAEGGWGIAGHAFGREDFARLAGSAG